MFKNKFLENRIVSSSFIVIFFTGIGIVINYIFQVFAGRMLEGGSYANMQSLFSLLTIVGVPAGAISMLIAKEVAEEKDIYGPYTRNIKYAYFLFLIISISGLFLSFYVSHFLNINYLYILFTFICAGISYPIALYMGILQGGEKFLSFSTVSFLQTIIKLFLGLSLLYFLKTEIGAMYAIFCGSIFSIFYIHYVLLKINKSGDSEAVATRKNIKLKDPETEQVKNLEISEMKNKISGLLPLSMVNIFLAIFMAGDIIIAKYFLNTDDIATFAYLVVIGKLPLYGLIAISQVLYPMYAKINKKISNTKLFSLYFLFAIFSGVTFFFFGKYFGTDFIHLAFAGKEAAEPAGLYLGQAFLVFTFIAILYSFLQMISVRVKGLKLLTILVLCSIIYSIILYYLINLFL